MNYVNFLFDFFFEKKKPEPFYFCQKMLQRGSTTKLWAQELTDEWGSVT